MITKKEYLKSLIIVKAYEFQESLCLYDIDGAIPFSEFEKFIDWLEENKWYRINDGEYNNDELEEQRLLIKDLYMLYKK